MIAEILALPGLWLLCVGAGLAGIVRGFTGFGTNIVYLPFAAQVLDPVSVLITILVMDSLGPLPAVPRAIRDGDPGDVARLSLGAIAGAMVGVSILLVLSPDHFRYAVCLIGLLLLGLLITGMRYRKEVGTKMTIGVGGIAGLLGGAIAAPGPVVIFFYMARPIPVQVIRANILLFLLCFDVIMVAIFATRGLLAAEPAVIGALLLPIYLAGVTLGSALFDPGREKIYRWIAYAIIAASAINGLPIWD